MAAIIFKNWPFRSVRNKVQTCADPPTPGPLSAQARRDILITGRAVGATVVSAAENKGLIVLMRAPTVDIKNHLHYISIK